MTPDKRRMGVLAIAGCIALAAAALSVLGAFDGPLSRYLDLAGQFAIQAGFGALTLAVLFIALRRFAIAGAGIAIAFAAYIVTGSQSPLAACTNAQTHRVFFFNVWDRNHHPEQTIDFIAHADADVIVLAEVNPRFEQALGELRRTYPHSIECPSDRSSCEFYVYSRVPIESHGTWPRGFIPLTVDFPEGKLDLTGIHAARPWPFSGAARQLHQTWFFSYVISRQSEARLVVGDFNAVTWGAIIRRLSKFGNVRPLPSRGTWLAGFPWPLRLPIDQTLVGPGIACATKSVGPRRYSDHRPIWIDFALESSAAPKP